MSKILITGCSSGFGLDATKFFLARGWDVVATMRTPNTDVLPKSDGLQILPLDVTKPESISQALAEAGPIDVLVNNAAFGLPSPVELSDPETVRTLFETNVFGTLRMVQAVLPSFRERRAGVIINVTSSVTVKALPLIGLYRASKAAVDAFTESLTLEVQPLGIRVHIVLPGRSPETKFGANAFPHLRGLDNPDYAPMIERVIASIRDTSGPVTHANDVSEVIWRVATDPSAPLRVPAGADAVAWMTEAQSRA